MTQILYFKIQNFFHITEIPYLVHKQKYCSQPTPLPYDCIGFMFDAERPSNRVCLLYSRKAAQPIATVGENFTTVRFENV